MLGKPKARQPPTVIVTTDEVICLKEKVKAGTCFLSRGQDNDDELYSIRSSSPESVDNDKSKTFVKDNADNNCLLTKNELKAMKAAQAARTRFFTNQ